MGDLFVLRHRERLPDESSPSAAEFYDGSRQIWIDVATGCPLVETLQNGQPQSKFGETALTESREGVDRNEIDTLGMSKFGETTMTKSQEGVDQSGEAPLGSNFGETQVTATMEGVDTSEGTRTYHAIDTYL